MKGTSRKPPAVKNVAHSRYVAELPKAQIARDLIIPEPTVYRVLDERGLANHGGRSFSGRAAHSGGSGAVEGRVERGDGRIGTSVLNGTGALKPVGNLVQSSEDAVLNSISRLGGHKTWHNGSSTEETSGQRLLTQ